MKVVELTAFRVRIPLKKPIKHASHTRTETENILVRCVLDDRSIGYGEGVPREYVTGETAERAIHLLQESQIPSQLHDCRTFTQAVEMIERVKTQPVPGDERQCTGNAARCAVELALLDAYARSLGENFTTLTKYVAPELYDFRVKIQYSGAITSAKGFKARLAAWKMRLYGFRQVKIKVGIEGHEDVARLQTIRSRIGRKMNLRIDANEAWKPDHVVAKIQELEPFGITSVEQPVAHADIACLKAVRSQVRTPIMLDESLCSYRDAQRAIEDGLCDLFNIRLSKCGGYIPSLRLAQLAQKHGLGYQLGCQVGETVLLSAAGRHFGSSVKDIRYLEGSYDKHLVKESLATKDITFGWGGWAPALLGVGHCVVPDLNAVDRVLLQKEILLG